MDLDSKLQQSLAIRINMQISLSSIPMVEEWMDAPLSRWLDFPADYNVKVLGILTLDGLCAYALARHFTRSRSAARSFWSRYRHGPKSSSASAAARSAAIPAASSSSDHMARPFEKRGSS